ncbi:MAG: glucose 1-dehydrogenase [Proteobacteria bacterium]|nr:glucose 1-dehydrogenase [Pseudomonadota bacterium]MBU4296118.1 glucose 1-dehydrogenase [Pseudomonadota bacterium]MCG2746733.1 glucose 1-dehydrogenase [Desulfobulbaceae bacterium]
MQGLAQQVVIVTGGAQGIGRGIVSYLLDREVSVVIADKDAEAGRDCLAELSSPERLLFMETDVTDESSVKSCIAAAVNRFQRINALVNNAGIADPGRTPIEETSLARWQQIIGTNLTGSFLLAKYAVPHLRLAHGNIINIASTRALQSEAHTEAYSASKGGLMALTHALAVSLGPAIRVNCISPGWIEVGEWQKKKSRRTPALSAQDHTQHPAGRVGTPHDVAAMVAFLISGEAGFITGQNFVIDGGMTRKMIYAE